MPSLPSIFDQCKPRPEVLAGELPDAIFAADLWEVFCQRAHSDYQDAVRFFAGTHPTENLKLLIKDVTERVAGVEGGTPIFRLETGFGGGKSHALIAAVHVAREGQVLAERLSDYGIDRFPNRGAARIAAFVGEESDPLRGQELEVDGQRIRIYTPWGQIALLAGGLAGYDQVRENDEQGIAPGRAALREALAISQYSSFWMNWYSTWPGPSPCATTIHAARSTASGPRSSRRSSASRPNVPKRL
jgi:predicted AAA+ superfamily ATPase